MPVFHLHNHEEMLSFILISELFFFIQVLIPLSKIEATNQSKNVENPSQKYIQIITVDNFDFWFIGFLNYQKTWKHLQQAIFLEPETQYVIAPFEH